MRFVEHSPLQPEEKEPAPEPAATQVQPSEPLAPAAEESEETWEEKEDKLDMENIEPEATKSVEQKYQYKEGKEEFDLIIFFSSKSDSSA